MDILEGKNLNIPQKYIFLLRKYLRNSLHLQNPNEKQNLHKQLHFSSDILR